MQGICVCVWIHTPPFAAPFRLNSSASPRPLKVSGIRTSQRTSKGAYLDRTHSEYASVPSPHPRSARYRQFRGELPYRPLHRTQRVSTLPPGHNSRDVRTTPTETPGPCTSHGTGRIVSRTRRILPLTRPAYPQRIRNGRNCAPGKRRRPWRIQVT